MRKYKRQTALARGLRAPPAWVAEKRNHAPAWICPTPETKQAFKDFVLDELRQRASAEALAYLARFVIPTTQRFERASLFDRMPRPGVVTTSSWRSPYPPQPKRRRGRPKASVLIRANYPPEVGARQIPIIRAIFEDYWGKVYAPWVSAVEIAAAFAGATKDAVKWRLRKSKRR